MPESRSEAETDEKGEKPSKNIISVISQFADDHLTFVRNISTGLAIAGVIVISRSIKLMTRFGVASEIPARFIENNVSLRGRVQTITERALEVEHVPIYIPLLSPLLTKVGQDLHCATFRFMQWTTAIVQHPGPLYRGQEGSLRSLCLNDEVLRLGLARTVPVSGLHPQSRLYLRLHQRLLRAEVKAERKGRGMWKEDSLWERTSQAVRENSLVRLIRRIFKWT
ncbi:protein C3orf33 homolog isoform X2 [Coregonus clupeaformis]|uniref:protein C3orf33 homolog isoform X2 n=1 Tax=Coregonus clupeaformis TaxID=59861 RepID=UPI001BE03EC7|nr:protein C3orf33 homolog isoform X2 [Coregonus clupeaformis]